MDHAEYESYIEMHPRRIHIICPGALKTGQLFRPTSNPIEQITIMPNKQGENEMFHILLAIACDLVKAKEIEETCSDAFEGGGAF